MDARLDACFAPGKPWHEELSALRAILLDCGLVEEWKWRQPCYCVEGGNVAILWAFKSDCGLGFFKGALLSDPEGLLVAPGENSRAARKFAFTSLDMVARLEPVVRAYVAEAVALERAGAKVDFAADPVVLPEELTARLAADAELRAAFEALTPGRQRGYALDIARPKQAATRAGRIDKHRARILAGKGLHDR